MMVFVWLSLVIFSVICAYLNGGEGTGGGIVFKSGKFGGLLLSIPKTKNTFTNNLINSIINKKTYQLKSIL